jgi:hypothetical protein
MKLKVSPMNPHCGVMEGQIQESFGRDIQMITFADFSLNEFYGWAWLHVIVVTRWLQMRISYTG